MLTLTQEPVYQTQWIYVTGQTTTWLEFGTGHQCEGYEYWYGGYGYRGAWQWLWTNPLTPTEEHAFYLEAFLTGGNQYWQWIVDKTIEHTYANGWKGYEDAAGLES